ncbi:MAG: site-2 protease family protein [Phycisphaerales bacterium]
MGTGWWVSDYIESGQSALLAARVFWVIVSICLHELAHGWAALWQGDDTPRRTGHMTINPLVHMGWPSLIVFALTGLAWGLMPVNPARFRSGRFGDLCVSAAGPAMNLLLAFLSLTVLGIFLRLGYGGANPSPTQSNVIEFFFIGGSLNLLLCVFNLLPVPPLDGSTIAASLSRKAWEFMHHPFVQQAGFFILLFVLFSAGVSSAIAARTHQLSIWWVRLIVGG